MQIFDTYNLRVRICANAAFLLPFLPDLLCLMPESLSLVDSLLVTAVCIVLCQIFLGSCWKEKRHSNRNAAAEFLASGAGLTAGTRSRYYRKLAQQEAEFQPLLDCLDPARNSDTVDVTGLCADAVTWLRAKSRDRAQFHLVHEENINYGFMRSMLMKKTSGIVLNSLAALLWGRQLLYTIGAAGEFTLNPCCWCFVIHLMAVFYYVIYVSEKAVDASARRYAYALLEVLDIL